MLNLLCIVLANFSVLASPTCGPTDEPTVGWVQHGGDFSKCDNQGPDQLSRVANVLACEAMAVSRGDVYFNFNFQMTGAGDYKCFTSNACPGRDATAYGQTQVITPNLDAFAKRSLTFERAYVQFSHCSPSRSSFMTGRTPQQTQVYNFVSSFRTVGRDWVTLPQYFKDNGYYVAGGGKLFHPDSSGPPLNNDQPLSWDSYYFPNDPEDKKYACNESTQLYFGVCPSEESADSFFDAQLAAAAMDELVVARDSGKHWFLGVGFERPHRPWNTPREFYDLYPNSGNAPTDIALD
ncbi:hypothetical protein EMIHUDRAFT_219397 [Emiliania huxleyi CCMP1516]|uniref:Ig-like domain-containing protein n=2 Tax=Emiliania huxleyi TaxID=2903 RepID=A0A0D3I4A9_EMIH1|nr:hypothetical protein EMIHUDRAFT_219397 [Emiliania huxleyi CCMP1516]EOD06094.1 hypothetical protein EMIHUDRAFT_219397 [Emiliania huxleyi CCMP1516]|eukprot:XP_005758523.1 hypothetical protein EMIHUDRAFT_219397 [Emiliania huxleyi CCMP1516]